MHRLTITCAVAAATALTLTACSSSAGFEEDLEGLTLEEFATMAGDSIEVELAQDVELDGRDAYAWTITSWEAESGAESAAEITSGDVVSLRVKSLLKDAVDACGAGTLGDGGRSLSIDTKGSDDFDGDSFEDIACIVAEVDFPDSVINKMDSTRALDGTLSDDWDAFEASWNYHPDSGMNLVLELRD